jgi:hypothetical protein
MRNLAAAVSQMSPIRGTTLAELQARVKLLLVPAASDSGALLSTTDARSGS